MQKKKIVIGIVALTSILLGYLKISSTKALENTIIANGTLEVTEIELSSEVSGRVESFDFEEGDKITKGQILAKINTDIYEAQLLQAKANLMANKARYLSLKSGARKQEIDQAKLLVDQSENLVQGYEKSYYNSKDIYQNRSVTKQQLDSAETQYKTSKTQFESAKANLTQLKSSFETNKSNLQRIKDLYEKQSVSKQQLDNTQNQYDIILSQLKIAEENIKQAKIVMDGSERNLKNVKDIYENRSQQKLQLDSAETQKYVASSNLEIAKKKYDLIKSDAKKEDLDSLKAAILQADAGLKLSELQLSRTRIKSIQDGILLTKNVEKGEVVAQGTTLATIADLSKIWLRVYVPEYQIGLVKLGQKANIKVDSFPTKIFEGKIIQIASKAEFTPRNVQTKEERVNQVFGVKILIPNKDLTLKSGMPADVEILVKQ